MTLLKKKLPLIMISGKEVLPIIEGGKGISVSTGRTAGAMAAAGAVGTFSAVNAESYDSDDNPLPVTYKGKTRVERHEELVVMGIKGGIEQAKIAHEISGGNGRIHMNVLWEMGGAQEILEGVLDEVGDLIHGITCGAGMPYRLAEIAVKYNVYYHPIVSSMRAFRALWKRSYSKASELLGGVVYEDPWLAGGHNGLSNSEDPAKPQDPYPRVAELRKFMNDAGLSHVPIIMAGGVWHLSDWESWIEDPAIAPVAFQFGTRTLLTQESPVPDVWKKRLLTLRDGDIYLNRFSPTGFYSSAIRNGFLNELDGRSKRQIKFSAKEDNDKTAILPFGPRKRPIYVTPEDHGKAELWIADGFDELMKTPDSTVIFTTKDKSEEIHKDQVDCMGCLSQCKFSNWSDDAEHNYSTGRKSDPRSFCIQKTLHNAVNGEDIENQLVFSGHNAYKFAEDPLYNNGFIPTVKQLVEKIAAGE
jgi:NAD(P)H-dependent flavin oxidoreductase YrpB (nitropropane dioxygenase family)